MKKAQDESQAVELSQVQPLLEWAEHVRVTCRQEADAVSLRLQNIAALRARWVNYWRAPKEQARAAWQEIVNKEKAGLVILDRALDLGKAAITAWARAERERAEAERQRLQAEAEAAAARERARLEREAARLKTPELREERLAAAAAVTAPEITVAAPAAPVGAQIRTRWKAELTDMTALIAAAAQDPASPAASLLAFDQAAANKLAVATRGAIRVPGVRFFAVEEAAILSK